MHFADSLKKKRISQLHIASINYKVAIHIQDQHLAQTTSEKLAKNILLHQV